MNNWSKMFPREVYGEELLKRIKEIKQEESALTIIDVDKVDLEVGKEYSIRYGNGRERKVYRMCKVISKYDNHIMIQYSSGVKESFSKSDIAIGEVVFKDEVIDEKEYDWETI